MFNAILFTRRVTATRTPAPFFLQLSKTALLLILSAFLAFIPSQSKAQSLPESWLTVEGGRIGYLLSTPSDSLEAEEQFSVKLFLDADSSNACIGASFTLGYATGVNLDPSDSYVVPETSWLGGSSDLDVVFDGDETELSANWTLLRDDTLSQYGIGWVLSAKFTVGEEKIAANSIVQSLSGGIITVENLDLKKFWEQEAHPEPKLFPNPFSNRLGIKNPGAEKMIVEVMEMSGKVMVHAVLSQAQTMATGHLPPGIYLARIRVPGTNQTSIQRLVKQ